MQIGYSPNRVGDRVDCEKQDDCRSYRQSQGIEQINTAVAQMDKVTQTNAANAEESASASEELSAQARELNEMVNTLVQIVGGNQAGEGHKAGTESMLLTVNRGAITHHPVGARWDSSAPSHNLMHHDYDGSRKTTKLLASPVSRKCPQSSMGNMNHHSEEVISLSDDDLKEF